MSPGESSRREPPPLDWSERSSRSVRPLNIPSCAAVPESTSRADVGLRLAMIAFTVGDALAESVDVCDEGGTMLRGKRLPLELPP